MRLVLLLVAVLTAGGWTGGAAAGAPDPSAPAGPLELATAVLVAAEQPTDAGFVAVTAEGDPSTASPVRAIGGAAVVLRDATGGGGAPAVLATLAGSPAADGIEVLAAGEASYYGTQPTITLYGIHLDGPWPEVADEEIVEASLAFLWPGEAPLGTSPYENDPLLPYAHVSSTATVGGATRTSFAEAFDGTWTPFSDPLLRVVVTLDDGSTWLLWAVPGEPAAAGATVSFSPTPTIDDMVAQHVPLTPSGDLALAPGEVPLADLDPVVAAQVTDLRTASSAPATATTGSTTTTLTPDPTPSAPDEGTAAPDGGGSAPWVPLAIAGGVFLGLAAGAQVAAGRAMPPCAKEVEAVQRALDLLETTVDQAGEVRLRFEQARLDEPEKGRHTTSQAWIDWKQRCTNLESLADELDGDVHAAEQALADAQAALDACRRRAAAQAKVAIAADEEAPPPGEEVDPEDLRCCEGRTWYGVNITLGGANLRGPDEYGRMVLWCLDDPSRWAAIDWYGSHRKGGAVGGEAAASVVVIGHGPKHPAQLGPSVRRLLEGWDFDISLGLSWVKAIKLLGALVRARNLKALRAMIRIARGRTAVGKAGKAAIDPDNLEHLREVLRSSGLVEALADKALVGTVKGDLTGAQNELGTQIPIGVGIGAGVWSLQVTAAHVVSRSGCRACSP